MKRRTIALSLLLVPTLAGCSLWDEWTKPEVAQPTNWQSTADGTGVWPDTAWWRGFGSTELDRLMGEASAGNLDLRAAVARVQQARANARIAGAAIYPTVDADASASRTSRFGSARTTTTTNWQAGLSVGYELDLFGRIHATESAALARLRSSRYDQEALALTVSANVALTYFQLLALRERIALATESLNTSRRLLLLLDEQRRIGTTSDLEVAQQRASVAQQSAAIPALRHVERQTLSTLALLLGRLPQDFAVAGQRLSALATPPVMAGMPSELLFRRPDVRSTEADLRAAHLDIAAARAARFPRIQLTADGGTASAALSGLFGPGSFLVTLVGGLAAPIFEGGRLRAQQQLTQARYEELMEAYRTATLSAFRDVENALSGATQFRLQLAAAREARAQSREAYRLAELRFRAGTVDFITVLDAQRSIISSDDSVVQAQLSQLSALVDLYKALGGGWNGRLPP
ncbi:MAG: efflux transporter outer membrane subunit [Alphaproteobacteria bacterium]|nr:efflux transporter outer membrane subunit [Alphaproteobacteria bacterium]MCW5740824.1 efflux transporter outer membrane subunit [Alphaproteobacteria bacterium]